LKLRARLLPFLLCHLLLDLLEPVEDDDRFAAAGRVPELLTTRKRCPSGDTSYVGDDSLKMQESKEKGIGGV